MVVVGGRDTELPIPLPLTMGDLPRLKLVLPSKRHGLRTELERHLGAEDVTLSPKLELDSPPGIADFVAQSDWFTVLPSIAVSRRLGDGSLRAYRIVTPRITRQLVAVHRPDQPMSTAAARLLDVIGEELAEISRRLLILIRERD